MKEKITQNDVEKYILSQINGLQEILLQFNYNELSGFVNLLKNEFKLQTNFSEFLTEDISNND